MSAGDPPPSLLLVTRLIVFVDVCVSVLTPGWERGGHVLMNPITKSQIRPDEYFNFPKKSINSNSKFQNFFQKNWRMLEKMNPSPGIKKKKRKT